jgi:lipoprotein-releasing system permease protein
MIKNINLDIALTHIITRKKQTLIAALGVTIGVGVYLFMNSLSSGFTDFSRKEIFKNSAHIKIYKDDEISKPITRDENTIIINPQITTLSKKIVNPSALLRLVKKQPYTINALSQVNFDAFYNRGSVQIKGSGVGVNMTDHDKMFHLGQYIVAGSINGLQGNLNGIIIGSGISEKLNLGLNDKITVSSSYGVSKTMQIVGIFKSGNNLSDKQKSYVNVATAQQFLKEDAAFVSSIFLNIADPDKTENIVKKLQELTSYKIEDWKTTNADILSGDKVRGTMMGAISLAILIVAAFGIYNILSATITQKINDIAILKATGFSGRDVIKIFVSEALIMGFIGTVLGLLVGGVLIGIMSNIYVGGPVGYFPITFEPKLFARSFLLGLVITLCAGFFPAKKAANVDPIEIFRK